MQKRKRKLTRRRGGTKRGMFTPVSILKKSGSKSVKNKHVRFWLKGGW